MVINIYLDSTVKLEIERIFEAIHNNYLIKTSLSYIKDKKDHFE